jgi:hypothetical protein
LRVHGKARGQLQHQHHRWIAPHPHAENGDILNIAYVFLRDGSMVYTQEKLHPTPSERRNGGTSRAAMARNVIPTDCGPIGVMICYDSANFPEMARHLVNQGAMMLFVPFCTDERRGYLRVRYCCQARAVENQCYVVTSGVVGNLPNVENMDVHYAESAILTPLGLPLRARWRRSRHRAQHRDDRHRRSVARRPAHQPPVGRGAESERPPLRSLPRDVAQGLNPKVRHPRERGDPEPHGSGARKTGFPPSRE